MLTVRVPGIILSVNFHCCTQTKLYAVTLGMSGRRNSDDVLKNAWVGQKENFIFALSLATHWDSPSVNPCLMIVPHMLITNAMNNLIIPRYNM